MFRKKKTAVKTSGKKNNSKVATNRFHSPTFSTGDLSGVIDLKLFFSRGNVKVLDCSFNSGFQNTGKQKNKTVSTPQDDTTCAVETDDVFVKENKILHRLNLSDIQYIQAMGDYVRIHTAVRKITLHNSLKSLEKKLPSAKFMRIHRSFMVAIKKIEAIEESTVYIDSNAIPIGEVYRSKLMKFLSIIK